VNDGHAVDIKESKVVCTPNKPKKKEVTNFNLTTEKADYILSFKINPEELTAANMTIKVEKCEAGFTRVCPSGGGGSCPEGMFNFCPYDNSPPDTADSWSCSCLQTRMLELDLQGGLNPLGECHEECICVDNTIEAILNKQKPTFLGPRQKPSYCNNN